MYYNLNRFKNSIFENEHSYEKTNKINIRLDVFFESILIVSNIIPCTMHKASLNYDNNKLI